MVIQESGGVLDAIKHLDMYKENIFDKLTVLEIYGKLRDRLVMKFKYFCNDSVVITLQTYIYTSFKLLSVYLVLYVYF